MSDGLMTNYLDEGDCEACGEGKEPCDFHRGWHLGWTAAIALARSKMRDLQEPSAAVGGILSDAQDWACENARPIERSI